MKIPVKYYNIMFKSIRKIGLVLVFPSLLVVAAAHGMAVLRLNNLLRMASCQSSQVGRLQLEAKGVSVSRRRAKSSDVDLDVPVIRSEDEKHNGYSRYGHSDEQHPYNWRSALYSSIFIGVLGRYMVPNDKVYADEQPDLFMREEFTGLIRDSGCDKKTKQIEQLLKENPKLVNASDRDGMTALMWAIIKKNKKLVRLLLDQNVQTRSKCGVRDGEYTSFHWAINSGNEEIVQLLIEYDSECIHETDRKGSNPLMWAVEWAAEKKLTNFNILNILLEKGLSVNYINKFGETPLMVASEHGNYRLVEFLLSHGADIDEQEKRGFFPSSALSCAIVHGHEQIVSLLLKHALKNNKDNFVNQKDRFGYTPLHTAIEYTAIGSNQKKIVCLLIDDYNADVEIESSCGDTPLMLAMEYGLDDIVEILMNRGASIKTSNDKHEVRFSNGQTFCPK